MKQKELLLATLVWIVMTMFLPLNAMAGEDGMQFSATISDNIEMNFTVISETNKTCMVGYVQNHRKATTDQSIQKITIPGTVQGYKVIKIGKGAFDYYKELTTVTLPGSIVEIEDDAFSDCEKLETFNFSEGLTTIGSYVFWGCNSLVNISLPNSLQSIGNSAFYSCSGLSAIHIPSGVKSIGQAAFLDCKALRSVTVDPNNTVYDSRENCNGIIETATNKIILSCATTTIPASVTAYGAFVFSLSDITQVTIPSHISLIEAGAFAGCRNLTSIRVEADNKTYDSRNDCNAIIETATNTLHTGCISTIIPDGMTTIGTGAFYMSRIESIKIPNSVVTIGMAAFEDCTRLKKITIPNAVQNIDAEAFGYCESLEEVTLPNTLSAIGDYAFYGCTSLDTIYSEIENPFYINDNVFGNLYEKAHLFIPYGTRSKYGETFAWKKFSFREELNEGSTFTLDLDDGTRMHFIVTSTENKTCEIGKKFKEVEEKEAAIDNLTLETITIPSTARGFKVTGIGAYAFLGCTGIKELVLPEHITSIGERAYQDCTGLTNIVLPSSIRNIGQYAFANCLGLTSVTTLINIPFNLDETAFMMADENYNPYIMYSVAKLYVPEGRGNLYKQTTGWKLFNSISEINPNGINAVSSPTMESVKWFSPDGKALNKVQHGLNIIRMSDGTTKKVIKK